MALDCFLLLRLGGAEAEEDVAELRRRWEADIAQPLAEADYTAPRLVLLPAQYREIECPLLELVAKIDAATAGRPVAILIPKLVVARVWQRLLHSRRAGRLRAALVVTAGPRLMVITSLPGAPS